MAERWQQWMPLYIDRFRGSMDMQALGPMGRSAFIYLLATAWQTNDCTLPADPVKLATASGLDEEEWALYAPRILEKFEQVGDRLRNQVLFQEWTAARTIFEKRRSGAERTNRSRSPRAERAHTARSADTGTETGTSTETEVQKLAPLPREREPLAGDASPPAFTFPLTGSRTHTLTEADVASYQRTYPAVDVRQELREVCQWLDANPDKHNRSIVGLKQRLVRWMSREQDKGGKHGSTAQGQTIGTRTHAAVDRQRIAHDSIRTAAARRYGLGALHLDGPDAGPLPQPDAPSRNPDMYLVEWEELALKFGLQPFRDALSKAIRSSRFFPDPSEIRELLQAKKREAAAHAESRKLLNQMDEWKAQWQRERLEDAA